MKKQIYDKLEHGTKPILEPHDVKHVKLVVKLILKPKLPQRCQNLTYVELTMKHTMKQKCPFMDFGSQTYVWDCCLNF